MKKVIFSVAMLAASSMPIFASGNPQQPICNQAQTCVRADSGQKCGNQEFEGINLTEEQKTKLADLRESTFNCSKRKAAGESGKDASGQQMKALKKEMRESRRETRKKYLDGVKSILTADQYILFLENNYVRHDGHKGISNVGMPHKGKKAHLKKATNIKAAESLKAEKK